MAQRLQNILVLEISITQKEFFTAEATRTVTAGIIMAKVL